MGPNPGVQRKKQKEREHSREGGRGMNDVFTRLGTPKDLFFVSVSQHLHYRYPASKMLRD